MTECVDTLNKERPQNACAMFDIRIGLNDVLKYNDLNTITEIADLNQDIAYKCADILITALKVFCKKYTFQLEMGDNNGYLHFQGRISLIKKHRLNEIKKLFKDDGKCPLFNYIAPTVNATYYKGDNFYVLKQETRVYGPWDERPQEIYIPVHYRNKINTLLPFQHTIFHSYNPLDDRAVHLVYCPEGNKGKSTLCSLIHLYNKGRLVPPFNNMRDIMTYLCDIYYEKEHTAGILCFDLPRAMPKSNLKELYSGIEMLKTGFLYDNRYRTREWWIDTPTIWVFTNSMPCLSMFSVDRWNIYEIQNNELIKMNIQNVKEIIKLNNEELKEY